MYSIHMCGMAPVIIYKWAYTGIIGSFLLHNSYQLVLIDVSYLNFILMNYFSSEDMEMS